MNLLSLLLLGAIAPLFAMTAAFGNPQLRMTEHQIYMIHSGVDEARGSYMFMITNSGPNPEEGSFNVVLPQETSDWLPLEGASKDDIKLGEDGGLTIAKVFPPGESLFSIGFVVPAQSGEAQMTLTPPNATWRSLSVMVGSDELNLRSERGGFTVTKNVKFGSRSLDRYVKSELTPSQPETIIISGIYQGRGSYYLIGSLAILVILAVGVVMFLRTKPPAAATS